MNLWFLRYHKYFLNIEDFIGERFGCRVEGDVLAVYKSFLITIQETPKEEGVGSVVKWHLEYERSDENVPHPENFLPFLVEMTKEIDEFLLSEE